MAAAAVVLAALLWDLRDEAEAPYPFAVSTISAGTPITESMVEWKNLPEGAIALPDLADPVAARDLPAGEPIVPSAVSGAPVVPDGWWSVPVPLSQRAVPGTQVRLIDAHPGLEVDGFVVAAGSDDLLCRSTPLDSSPCRPMRRPLSRSQPPKEPWLSCLGRDALLGSRPC